MVFVPDFITYEVPDKLFVVGGPDRVDVQFFNRVEYRSPFLVPVKLFTEHFGLVELYSVDSSRRVFVRPEVRRDGLEPPEVYSLAQECGAGIRLVRDWCLDLIVAKSEGS